MQSRLYLFLEPNNVFYYLKQFGFRNGHSTTLTLLAITGKIREACDKGFFSLVGYIFLDFKKAFDTESHSSFDF